jgi:hypothetical protein
MKNLLCCIVPWFGGNTRPLLRTLLSVADIADEAVIVHQVLFDSDKEVLRVIQQESPIPIKIEEVNWNTVFTDGYGVLPNKHGQANSDWMLLLGTGETVAEQYMPIKATLRTSARNIVWRCNHVNDDNTWGRLWHSSAGVHWSGLIHEEAGGGTPGPRILFRMQDTPKEPHPDPFVNEALKWMKVTSYDENYYRLLKSINPETGDSPLRGATNKGWLGFVKGSAEAREAKQIEWADLLVPARAGDREGFLSAVRARMEAENKPVGCNYAPTGEPMTPGA